MPAGHAVVPLDAAVRALFETTWGKARAWVASGKVSLHGERVLDPLRRVRPGDVVEVRMAAPRIRGGHGEDTGLPVSALVHVDPHVVVVAKPSGVSSVPFDENETGTLDALVRDRLAAMTRGGAKGGVRPNLGVVHRIDKETSGLLVFTRTWLAKQSLTAQFRAHTTHRRYVALVHGKATTRTITSHLVEDRGDGLRGSLEAMAARGKRRGTDEGQRAVTHIEVLEELDGATLVACRLETGRTHQIRIHLSESGHPLVGERVYVRGFLGPEIKAPRLMLHAEELGFVHPQSEEEVRFTLPPPADFEKMLERLRRKSP